MAGLKGRGDESSDEEDEEGMSQLDLDSNPSEGRPWEEEGGGTAEGGKERDAASGLNQAENLESKR